MDYFNYISLLILLCFLTSKGNGAKCYICSFSPRDRNNRTDKCTEENFSYHEVFRVECKIGCETVVQYDANDELEQWRRNCLQDGQKAINECVTEKTPGWTVIRCSCNENLCNASTGIWLNLSLAIFVIMRICFPNL